jgi:hypothetical protein
MKTGCAKFLRVEYNRRRRLGHQLARRVLVGRAPQFLARASRRQRRSMTWIDFVGYLAALTVLMTFCMDTIVPLRGLAIASNVLFIVYGRAALSRAFTAHPIASHQRHQNRAAASARDRPQAQKRGARAPRHPIAGIGAACASSPSSRYVERSGTRVDRAADGQIPKNGSLAFYSSSSWCSAWCFAASCP